MLIIGNSQLGEERISTLQDRFRNRVNIIATGHRSEPEVSTLLKTLDFGFAASPWDLIGKSASAATMHGHGVPIVVSRDDWKLRSKNQLKVLNEGMFRTIEEALSVNGKPANVVSLTDVSLQFLHDLQFPPFPGSY